MLAVGRAGVGVLLREVRDGIWGRVLAAEATDQRVVGLAGFGESVVSGVEVFALLQLVLKEVLLVRKLAIEAEELLFFFGERLYDVLVSWEWFGRDGRQKSLMTLLQEYTYAHIHLVLLVWVHLCCLCLFVPNV